jgi:hypothetical protein
MTASISTDIDQDFRRNAGRHHAITVQGTNGSVTHAVPSGIAVTVQ